MRRASDIALLIILVLLAMAACSFAHAVSQSHRAYATGRGPAAAPAAPGGRATGEHPASAPASAPATEEN